MRFNKKIPQEKFHHNMNPLSPNRHVTACDDIQQIDPCKTTRLCTNSELQICLSDDRPYQLNDVCVRATRRSYRRFFHPHRIGTSGVSRQNQLNAKLPRLQAKICFQITPGRSLLTKMKHHELAKGGEPSRGVGITGESLWRDWI